MELVFAAVGFGCLFVCVFSLALCRAAALGDEAWRQALDEEPERDWQWPARWTGIRQDPVIREWSSNAEADEEFARAFEQRRRDREAMS